MVAPAEPEILHTWNVRWVDVSIGWEITDDPGVKLADLQRKPGVRYAAPPQISAVASLENSERRDCQANVVVPDLSDTCRDESAREHAQQS
jgi:hypothetical protein